MSCYGTCFCQSNNKFYISYTNTIIDSLHILLYIHVYYIFTRECLIKLRYSVEKITDRLTVSDVKSLMEDYLMHWKPTAYGVGCLFLSQFNTDTEDSHAVITYRWYCYTMHFFTIKISVTGHFCIL